MYYPYSENKDTDQLRGYREADLRLCLTYYAKSWFSHDEAQIRRLDILDIEIQDSLPGTGPDQAARMRRLVSVFAVHKGFIMQVFP